MSDRWIYKGSKAKKWLGRSNEHNTRGASMLADFEVGVNEVHRVEVFSSFLGGKEIVKVDGVQVLDKRKFPLWITDEMQFEVGDEEKHFIVLKYNAVTMKSEVYVDDALHVERLFPQVIRYNIIILAFSAFLAFALVFLEIMNTASD
jgi:hypothetical protein